MVASPYGDSPLAGGELKVTLPEWHISPYWGVFIGRDGVFLSFFGDFDGSGLMAYLFIL